MPDACAAMVGRARHKPWEHKPATWLGWKLPVGSTGQQAEALGGWCLLSTARLAVDRGAVPCVYLFIDSGAVFALIRAVHGSPLKAKFRQLAPWVEPYRQVLTGWKADLWLIRTTSHSLPEWIQESDAAAAADWPVVMLWRRNPLRVEVRRLAASRTLHMRSLVHSISRQPLPPSG